MLLSLERRDERRTDFQQFCAWRGRWEREGGTSKTSSRYLHSDIKGLLRILECIPLQCVLVSYSFSSVQFTSVASDCLRPHKSQHARPPCPPTPGVHSNSCPSSGWCHQVISSSVVPFSTCPQSLPASESSNKSTLRMRWPKYCSFSFSIIPSKENPGLISFRMDWLDLLAVQGTLKNLLQHHSSKASILRHSAFLHSPTLTSIHAWPLEKP